MGNVAKFRVTGKFEQASREERATVTINRVSKVLTVRPYKKRRTYEMPLSVVAEWVVLRHMVSEANARRAAKKLRRK